MLRKPRVRSRNGCFTCRRRKKKCDESSYPSCKNCTSNKLQCSWPDHVVSVHQKEQGEKPSIPEDKHSENIIPSVSSPKLEIPNSASVPSVPTSLLSGDRVSKPERKGRNYILQRISMQQDCVEDLQDDLFEFLDSVVVGPIVGQYNAAPVSLIRERIARQLDIPGEDINHSHFDENNTQI